MVTGSREKQDCRQVRYFQLVAQLTFSAIFRLCQVGIPVNLGRFEANLFLAAWPSSRIYPAAS